MTDYLELFGSVLKGEAKDKLSIGSYISHMGKLAHSMLMLPLEEWHSNPNRASCHSFPSHQLDPEGTSLLCDRPPDLPSFGCY